MMTLKIHLNIVTEAQDPDDNPYFGNCIHGLSSPDSRRDVFHCSGLKGNRQVYTEGTRPRAAPASLASPYPFQEYLASPVLEAFYCLEKGPRFSSTC